MTCLWETWRNAAAGDETVNYAFFTLKCTHHQDVAARSWQLILSERSITVYHSFGHTELLNSIFTG